MDRVDCVVVGAGVVGIAIARALSQAGREVIVLDAAEGIGTGTSSRNSEVIHAGIYYPKDSLMARFCVAGRRKLYADVVNAFAAPGGIKTFQIGFRSSLVPGLTVNASLRYDLVETDTSKGD